MGWIGLPPSRFLSQGFPLMSSNDAMACMVKGVECLDAGDLEGALSHLEAAIKRDAYFALPYFHRGVLRQKQGKPDDAIKDFDKALRLNAQLSEAYYQRGIIIKKKGD